MSGHNSTLAIDAEISFTCWGVNFKPAIIDLAVGTCFIQSYLVVPHEPLLVEVFAAGEPPQLPEHSLFLPIAPIIIAVAQPTPDCTLIAFTGQFNAQAPHSMHDSLSIIAAFRS